MRFIWSSIVAATCCSAIGCDKPKVAIPADAAPSATASAAPSPRVAARPDDVDVSRIREPFKCVVGAKKLTPICAFLEEFDKADAWNLESIRGTEARYFGQAIIVSKGVTRTPWYFLIAKRVPTNEVPAGDLPLRIAVRELEESLKNEHAHAPRLLRALEHDNGVNKLNQTADYVMKYAPGAWDGASVTAGPSTILHSEGGAFIREGRGRRLHMIRMDAVTPGAVPGDGVYVTVYPLSW